MQQKTREMEKKYREAMAEKNDIELDLNKYKTKMNDMELELHDVDRINKRLESDKNLVMKTADREMVEAKDELEKSRHELEDQDREIAALRAVSHFLKIFVFFLFIILSSF